MNSKPFSFLLAATILLTSVPSFSEILTPPSNLAGLKSLKERISVELNLKGADEFNVEIGEIVSKVRSTLSSADLSYEGGGMTTPRLIVDIKGESAGNGGASFTVELAIRVLIPSPLVAERTADAILWRKSIASHHISRYDPAAKKIIPPSGTIKERVYETVVEVSKLLVADLKLVKD